MSQSIVSRTISSVVDKRLVLGNSQAARLFTITTAWTKIRIGIRVGLDAQGSTSNLTGTPRFAFGLCHLDATAIPSSVAGSNLYADVSCDHFFGMRSTQATWTYQANAGDPYLGNMTGAVTRRLLTTDTDSATMFTSIGMTTEPDARRNAYFLDILKGSPNYTVWAGYPNNVSAHSADVTEGMFLQMMEAAAFSTGSVLTAILSGMTNTTGAGTTLACDEGTVARELNGIGVFWDRTSHLLEISDVAMAVIA